MPTKDPAPPAADTCEKCYKPRSICICDRLTPLKKTRTEVLILQHPQEPDKVIGTARLTELALPSSVRVVVGLSWASLSQAVGRDVENKDWAILYRGALQKELTPEQLAKPILVLDRVGNEVAPKTAALKGIVVLDGTWSQAKTLWWRNPWMLKLNRLLLNPEEPSLYGKLRKEPQRECLSTIEAVAESLQGLGEPPALRAELKRLFRTLLQRARDVQKAEEVARPPAPRKPRGRPRSSGKSKGGGPLD